MVIPDPFSSAVQNICHGTDVPLSEESISSLQDWLQSPTLAFPMLTDPPASAPEKLLTFRFNRYNVTLHFF